MSRVESTTSDAMRIVDRGSVLPQLTNRWLGVNDVPTEEEAFPAFPARPFGGACWDGQMLTGETAEVALEGMDEVRLLDKEESESLAAHWDEPGRGISPAILHHNAEAANLPLLIQPAHGSVHQLEIALSEADPLLADRLHVRLETGVVSTLVVDVKSQDDREAFRNGTLLIDLEADSLLQLVLIDRFHAAVHNNFSLSFRAADGAQLKIAHVELGAARSNINISGDLLGAESELDAYDAYLVQGSSKLDLFYDIRFYGELSRGTIHADGALFDQAYKSFRGTLDFREGCVGAVGDEEESAVLMSDEVHSVAVPLLLCHEEAVQGNHATSAGRMDEEMLFYLMSRGISAKEAEGLIVESRMVPTLDQIPDPALRESIRAAIHEQIVRP